MSKKIKNNKTRNKYGILAGIFGIVTNIILAIIKTIIGLTTNSISILADAINNITDTASSIITILGFKFSEKKPSENHPYGYARYEYVSNLFISLSVLLMGIIFLKESILKIINPIKIEINLTTYLTLLIAIIIKLIQMIIYLNFSKKIESATLKSASLDSRNDILSTSAILISMIVMSIYNINIDGYIALFVSVFIIISSLKLLKQAIDPLIGIKPTEKQVKKIIEKIKSYKEIIGFHDLVIHNYGSNIDFITVHIEIDSNKTFKRAHQIAEKIEEDFYNELGYNMTIHMDPTIINDPVIDDYKKRIGLEIIKFDNKLKIHDFRMIRNKTKTKVLFDCVIPYNKNYKASDIETYLKNKFGKENEEFKFIIKIDHDYC